MLLRERVQKFRWERFLISHVKVKSTRRRDFWSSPETKVKKGVMTYPLLGKFLTRVIDIIKLYARYDVSHKRKVALEVTVNFVEDIRSCS